MAYTKIINEAYNLADEIKKSYLYKELKSLDQIIKTKYNEELKNYHETFKKFDEVFNNGGIYHPDYKEINALYRTAKMILYNKDEVKEYLEKEQKMNQILKEIADEITNSVSNYENFKGGLCQWK